MWSAKFLPHVYNVSVSPTNGNGPTQGQRKALTGVGIESTTFGLDHRCSTDWATRSDGSRSWELKMLKSRQWTCTSKGKNYVFANFGRVALIFAYIYIFKEAKHVLSLSACFDLFAEPLPRHHVFLYLSSFRMSLVRLLAKIDALSLETQITMM